MAYLNKYSFHPMTGLAAAALKAALPLVGSAFAQGMYDYYVRRRVTPEFDLYVQSALDAVGYEHQFDFKDVKKWVSLFPEEYQTRAKALHRHMRSHKPKPLDLNTPARGRSRARGSSPEERTPSKKRKTTTPMDDRDSFSNSIRTPELSYVEEDYGIDDPNVPSSMEYMSQAARAAYNYFVPEEGNRMSRTSIYPEYQLPPGVTADRVQYTVPIRRYKKKVPKWERLPYNQWFANLPDEEKSEYLKRKAMRSGRYKKRYRRSGRRMSYRKRRRVGGRGSYMDITTTPRAGVCGLGDYNIKQNSLVGAINMGTDPPTVSNSKKGEATIFQHREYIGELFTGPYTAPATVSPFNLQSFAINPGNVNLFPWFRTIAENFQEWEPRGILMELKTESSDYAQTVTLGSMFMGVDYTSMQSNAPTTKQQLENLEYSVSGKPSRSIILPIECAPQNDTLTHLYVAVDSNYNGADPRFCDLGILYIGTQGIPASNVPLAEIWVTYEIALFKPRLYSTPNINVPTIHLAFIGTNNGAFISGLINTYETIYQNGDFTWQEAVNNLYFPASSVEMFYTCYMVNTNNAAAITVTTQIVCDLNGGITTANDLSSLTAKKALNNQTSITGSIVKVVFHYQTIRVPPNSGNTCYIHYNGYQPAFGSSGFGDLFVCSTGPLKT